MRISDWSSDVCSSDLDITQANFFDSFMKRLAESGFPRHRLTIEITESGLIEDLAAASTLLAQWREAGLRVAIDDFGTGYFSLAYLKSLPFDYLYIDRGLATDIAGSERERTILPIGRAAWWERSGPIVLISGGAVSFKKKKKYNST